MRETETRPAPATPTCCSVTWLAPTCGSDTGPRVRRAAERCHRRLPAVAAPDRPEPADLHQVFVELRRTVREKAAHRRRRPPGDRDWQLAADLRQSRPEREAKLRRSALLAYRAPSWRVAPSARSWWRWRVGTFDYRADGDSSFWGGAIGPPDQARTKRGGRVIIWESTRRTAFYAQGQRSGKCGTPSVESGAARRPSRRELRRAVSVGGLWWAAPSERGRWRPRRATVSPAGRVEPHQLRTDIAAGDRDAGRPTLESFNPLFPGNSYQAPSDCSDPPTSTDLTPAVTVSPPAGSHDWHRGAEKLPADIRGTACTPPISGC